MASDNSTLAGWYHWSLPSISSKVLQLSWPEPS